MAPVNGSRRLPDAPHTPPGRARSETVALVRCRVPDRIGRTRCTSTNRLRRPTRSPGKLPRLPAFCCAAARRPCHGRAPEQERRAEHGHMTMAAYIRVYCVDAAAGRPTRLQMVGTGLIFLLIHDGLVAASQVMPSHAVRWTCSQTPHLASSSRVTPRRCADLCQSRARAQSEDCAASTATVSPSLTSLRAGTSKWSSPALVRSRSERRAPRNTDAITSPCQVASDPPPVAAMRRSSGRIRTRTSCPHANGWSP